MVAHGWMDGEVWTRLGGWMESMKQRLVGCSKGGRGAGGPPQRYTLISIHLGPRRCNTVPPALLLTSEYGGVALPLVAAVPQHDGRVAGQTSDGVPDLCGDDEKITLL